MTNIEQTKKRFRRRNWIIAAVVLSPVALILLWPAPSLQAISPDGRLQAYVDYSGIVLPEYSDCWVRVGDLTTGETVNVHFEEGGFVRYDPTKLSWSRDGRQLTYTYNAEVIGALSRTFDIGISPLKVKESNNRQQGK